MSDFFQQHTLQLHSIRSLEDLEMRLTPSFIALFQECFAGYPYFEAFTEAEIRERFAEYVAKEAQIYLVEEGARTIAFAVSHGLEQEPALVELLSECVPEETIYMADAGVDPAYRRKGISLALEKLRLFTARDLGRKFALLRTSESNYKKIAISLKNGGTKLSATQKVDHARTNGQVWRDDRIFIQFDLSKYPQGNPEVLERVVVARPGGNDTALVFGTYGPERHRELNASIQFHYPGVEQVMFVETAQSLPHGQMAGGEFCGNATRAAGFTLLQGSDGEIIMTISGATHPLAVRVHGGQSIAEMPVRPSLESLKEIGKDLFQADLEGITHLIAREGSSLYHSVQALPSEAERKAFVRRVLAGIELDQKEAAGIMFLSQTPAGQTKMDPYVFVKAVNTLYHETACASGTTAVGMLIAKETGAGVREMPILQPSGMALKVTVELENETFQRATIDGEVEILFDGPMYLNREVYG